MKMKLKIEKGIRLTQEQANEIANSIMREPDMGWEDYYQLGEAVSERHKAYKVELYGEHGVYDYKINLSWELITIEKVR